MSLPCKPLSFRVLLMPPEKLSPDFYSNRVFTFLTHFTMYTYIPKQYNLILSGFATFISIIILNASFVSSFDKIMFARFIHIVFCRSDLLSTAD